MTEPEASHPISTGHHPISTQLPPALLAWGDAHRRDLPWRRTRDPWRVLVSETMLQQTQVSRVIDRYRVFLDRFPTPQACAEGAAADVIELWAGLGYNRRAVNLHRAAIMVTDEFGGQIPADRDLLRSLPGVGPYTASAILAFAFEHDVGVVDTNVGRLLARWSGERQTARTAQQLADALVPVGQGWAWNQTLFDFAVAVCAKRSPSCADCPIRAQCVWQGRGDDPARASAGVSAPQSRFEGSARQVRGRIIDALRIAPLDQHALGSLARAIDTDRDLEAIVQGLVDDGLAERDRGLLRLPMSPRRRPEGQE